MSAPGPSLKNSCGFVPFTVTVLPVAAAIALPLVMETITAGMVGTGVVPSWAMAIGSPAWLLITMTPIAPAFWAFRTLVVNVQAPLRIRAILPVRLVLIAVQPFVGLVVVYMAVTA